MYIFIWVIGTTRKRRRIKKGCKLGYFIFLYYYFSASMKWPLRRSRELFLLPRGLMWQGEFSVCSCCIILDYGVKTFVFRSKLLSLKNHIIKRWLHTFVTYRDAIEDFESNFLLLTIICSVPISSDDTATSMITSRSLGSRILTRMCHCWVFERSKYLLGVPWLNWHTHGV